MPDQIRFTTWTLRYNQMLWLTVDGLEEHWERARIDADLDRQKKLIRATTKNISAISFSFAPGLYPFDITHQPQVMMDGQILEAPRPFSDRSWTAHFEKQGNKWGLVNAAEKERLHKQHGLQGPVDDAFMDSFIMVRPTGNALNEKIGSWTAAELAHATNHWRQQFRGLARVKDDREISEAEIASNNLVLWGDASSNKLLARIADQLPIRWDQQNLVLGNKTFAAANHVPVLIYPNPLNPKHYIVLNSGFTFREYDYLNNARQVPKLPDYAIVDVNVPSSSRAPGGVVEAGFFGEQWEITPPSTKPKK